LVRYGAAMNTVAEFRLSWTGANSALSFVLAACGGLDGVDERLTLHRLGPAATFLRDLKGQ